MTERERNDDREPPVDEGETVSHDTDLPDEPGIAGAPQVEPGGLGRMPAPPD